MDGVGVPGVAAREYAIDGVGVRPVAPKRRAGLGHQACHGRRRRRGVRRAGQGRSAPTVGDGVAAREYAIDGGRRDRASPAVVTPSNARRAGRRV